MAIGVRRSSTVLANLPPRRTRVRRDEPVRLVYAGRSAPRARRHAPMTNCPACGSADIHRSRSASLVERSRKLLSSERPHRCHACGWRGWGDTTPHHHAAIATSDGWEALDIDLSGLDAAAAEHAAQRATAAAASPAAASGSRRRSRSRRVSRARATEFNRRVQLVLLVALLLAGVILVLRACGGSRTLEPEGRPVGQWAVDSG